MVTSVQIILVATGFAALVMLAWVLSAIVRRERPVAELVTTLAPVLMALSVAAVGLALFVSSQIRPSPSEYVSRQDLGQVLGRVQALREDDQRLQEEGARRAESAQIAALADLQRHLDETLQRQAQLEKALQRVEQTVRSTVQSAPPPVAPASNRDPRLIGILYATDRNWVDNVGFGFGRVPTLAFGAATIRIPENHKIGVVEEPGPTFLGFTLYGNSDTDKERFRLASVNRMTEAEFENGLNLDFSNVSSAWGSRIRKS
jgi:hypothetical protein